MRDDTNPFVKELKIMLSYYMRSDIKKKIKKRLPMKVVLHTSRGMSLKPQVEKNMVDTQFVVKRSHMNTPICTTFFIPMAYGSA